MFVPTESLLEASIWLLMRMRLEKKVASRCPGGQDGIDSLELFTYSPGLEPLDEHQDTRFQCYNTEICARGRLAALPAGSPGSCRTWPPDCPAALLDLIPANCVLSNPLEHPLLASLCP